MLINLVYLANKPFKIEVSSTHTKVDYADQPGVFS